MARSSVAGSFVCGFALLASLPLSSQVPKAPSLASPVPPVRPLAELISSPRGSEVERLLVAGRWEEARAGAQSLLLAELSQDEAGPTTAAADFALLALAKAGLGDTTGAICRWHAAQAFDPDFLGADLAAYGDAGRMLEDHPLEDLAKRKEGPPSRVGGEVSRPELVSQRRPEYSPAARKARVQGVVILEAVIGKDGKVSQARVLKGLPLGLSAAAIDAVCDWRFKPAATDDGPVEAFYILTVNFQLDVRPQVPIPAQ